MMQHVNPFVTAQEETRLAIAAMGGSPELYAVLKAPARFVEVQIPVRMDDGRLQVFTGYRSQHVNVLGPAKGGLRFHPDVTPDEVRALSMWMSYKTAVAGLPYGGGKGGIVVDPKQLSEGELERLSRGFVQALWQIIGPDQDIPAPDVNTNPKIMAWMTDEYERIAGHSVPAVFTGKPLALGGSLGRTEATGRGTVIVIREAARLLGLSLKGARVAIQGFGNAGTFAGLLLEEQGAVITAISDSTGGIFDPSGLNAAAVMAHKSRTGSVQGFPGSEPVSQFGVLTAPVEILVPAALENQIDAHVAEQIQAKIIAEAANGPTTPDGDAVLAGRGIFTIPDILASAGGVTVSYFEWVQNRSNFYWSEAEVNAKLEDRMVQAFHAVHRTANQYDTTMRMGAFIYAIGRIAAGLEARGIVRPVRKA
jgi:glutamate dehydrogenase